MREVWRTWKSRMMTMWKISCSSKHTKISRNIHMPVYVLPPFKVSDNSFRDCTLISFRSGTSGQAAPSEFHLLQYSALLDALPGVQPKLVIWFQYRIIKIYGWTAPRNFYQLVNFTAFGQFVNPTRDLVTCVVNDKDHLVISDTRWPAVFLTTGVVLTCNLICPTLNNQQVLVKKIQVIPVVYEYWWLINFLGARYGKTDLYGYVSPEIALTFSSHKEGSGQSMSPFSVAT